MLDRAAENHHATRLRAVVRLSALVAVAPEEEVEAALREALALEIPPAVVAEVLLQSYLFVGYPRTINALVALRRALGGKAVHFLKDSAAQDRAEWRRRGEELCRTIYGPNYSRLRENIAQLHPDLDRWMVEEGYGKVLSRPGLTPRQRELAILPILLVGGMERQLRSHLAGALRVGATREDLVLLLEAVQDRAPAATLAAARKLMEEATG